MKLKSIALATAVTALSLGVFQFGGDAAAQQGTTINGKQLATTWFHISEVVAQPNGCQASAVGSGSKGLITLATADGRSWASYLPLPASGTNGAKQADEAEPLALLSAYVVRPDGTPDPAYGAGPKDMVILTTGDGRVIVSFTDFNADPEAYTYAYPARVKIPGSKLTN